MALGALPLVEPVEGPAEGLNQRKEIIREPKYLTSGGVGPPEKTLPNPFPICLAPLWGEVYDASVRLPGTAL